MKSYQFLYLREEMLLPFLRLNDESCAFPNTQKAKNGESHACTCNFFHKQHHPPNAHAISGPSCIQLQQQPTLDRHIILLIFFMS